MRDFSSWLQYGIGLGVRERAERELSYPSRVYASGGGFYSVTSWLVINNVEGIENGFYKYQPYTHTLYPQKTAEYDFSEILAGSFDFEHAGGVILYGLELDRAFVKYGDLIVLLGLVEVGNMTHSLELAGSGWGIGSCQVGGFNKGYVERMLNFDGLNQHVVFSQIFGKRRG